MNPDESKVIQLIGRNVLGQSDPAASAAKPRLYHRFLTHVHSDHLRNLTESFDDGLIYCTEVTRKILTLKFPLLNQDLFREVRVGEKRLIYSDETDPTSSSFAATPVDARHCPGAVMYLFQSSSFGNVLHTGDFRAEDAKLMCGEIRAHLEAEDVLDCVYLDNTYGAIDAPSFPARPVVAQALVEVMKLYPETTRFCVRADTWGKEELYETLARELNTKIVVSETKRAMLEATDLWRASAYTTDAREGRVELIPRNAPRFDESASVVDVDCTGWCGGLGYEELRSLRLADRKLPRRLCAPYSLHSSHEELVAFLHELRPRFVLPTVDTSSLRDLGENWVLPAPPRPLASSAQEPVGSALGGSESSLLIRNVSVDSNNADEQEGEGEDLDSSALMARHPQKRPPPPALYGARFYAVVRVEKRRKNTHVRVSDRLDAWSPVEDDALRRMRAALLANDADAHARLRCALAKRTDAQCFGRMRELRGAEPQARDH